VEKIFVRQTNLVLIDDYGSTRQNHQGKHQLGNNHFGIIHFADF
jgi:hypothetical protein